jgi:hypothetical protein
MPSSPFVGEFALREHIGRNAVSRSFASSVVSPTALMSLESNVPIRVAIYLYPSNS